jgi:hypothetical protein
MVKINRRKSFPDLRENTKGAERMNKSRSSGKNKPTLLQHYNARAHTSVANSAAVEHITTAQIWYRLICGCLQLKETSQTN